MGHADLGHRDEVQRRVELSVAAAGEPVADPFAAGGLHGSGAGVAGERVRSREPGGPAAAADEARRQHRAHSVDGEQPARAGFERVDHVLGDRLKCGVEAPNLAREVPRQLLSGALDASGRADAAQQRCGAVSP